MSAPSARAKAMREPTSSGESTPTNASLVHQQLRRDILFGMFEPQSKLSIEELRQRYQVSPIPVREALNRLAAEGLIEHAEQKGFFIPSLGVEALRELVDTLGWVHEIMVRETLRGGDEAWEESVVLAAHRLFKVPRYPDGQAELNPEWEVRHRAFHLALVSGCPSQWMREFHAELLDYVDRYRHYYLSGESRGEGRDVGDEHRQLLEAAVAHDAERLTGLLNLHARRTMEIIVATIGEARDKPRPSRRR